MLTTPAFIYDSIGSGHNFKEFLNCKRAAGWIFGGCEGGISGKSGFILSSSQQEERDKGLGSRKERFEMSPP
jgi:hypothetical protein